MPQADSKLSWKKRFLQHHKICCYCGVKPAVQIEHCPARGFFPNKIAPEGFIFPSCHDCNQSLRNIEQVVAAFIEMRLDPEHSLDRLARLVQHAKNNMPGLEEELTETFGLSRYAARPSGLIVPHSQARDLIEIRRTGPIVSHCFDIIGHKFTRALYYKHVEEILRGQIFCRVQPMSVFREEINEAIAQMTPAGLIERNNIDLSDYFKYFYLHDTEEGLFSAVIILGDELAYVTYAMPENFWLSLKSSNPEAAKDFEMFGRPDLYKDH